MKTTNDILDQAIDDYSKTMEIDPNAEKRTITIWLPKDIVDDYQRLQTNSRGRGAGKTFYSILQNMVAQTIRQAKDVSTEAS